MTREVKIWIGIIASIPMALVVFFAIDILYYSVNKSLARKRLEPMLEQRAKQVFADQKLQEQLIVQITKDSENEKENPSFCRWESNPKIGIGVVQTKSGEYVFTVFVEHHSNDAELNKVWYWGKDRILRTSSIHICTWPGKFGIITCAADICE